MGVEIFYKLFATFFLPSFLFFLFLKKKRTNNNIRRLPPGPKTLPIIGNLHQVGELPHISYKILSKEYGDLMFLELGSAPILVVSSAKMAREIFKSHEQVILDRPISDAFMRFSYNGSNITDARYGKPWREMRKIMALELMTAKRVQSFQQIRIHEVSQMLESIARAKHQVVNLSALAFALTRNVVCRAAFSMMSDGDGMSGKYKRFQEIHDEANLLMSEFNVGDYFTWMSWVNKFNGLEKRLEKNFRDMDAYFENIITEHLDPKRHAADHEDIVDVLLRIQKDPTQSITLTKEQVKGVISDIFLNGSDTSTATIVWTMSELMRNPAARERAQQEVREVAKGKAKVEEADIAKLTYLKQVIKESLRLHPPAPLLLPRETTENCIIDGKYEIPANTTVVFNAVAIHTDPRQWENPDKFQPERFSESQIDYRGTHFELLPFGFGRRGCPGINFAIPVVELGLANLLHCFDWELPQGMKTEDLDMEEAPGIIMLKKAPLCLVPSLANA